MKIKPGTHRRGDVEDTGERVELLGGRGRLASADCMRAN